MHLLAVHSLASGAAAESVITIENNNRDAVEDSTALVHSAFFSFQSDASIFYSETLLDAGTSGGFKEVSESTTLTFAPSMRIGRKNGIVVESAFEYIDEKIRINDFGTSTEISDTRLQRFFTRAVYDLPEAAIRAQIGDVFVQPTNLQNGADLLGLNIGTSYNQLQPGRNVISSGRRTFVLERQSRVEVFVNGAFVDELTLQSGSYDLSDFPIDLGTGQVSLRIRGPAGDIEDVNFASFLSTDLLEAGVSEWNIALGVEATNAFSGREYDDDRPIASAFFRRGFTPGLTAGLDVQADQDTTQLGASATVAIGTGLLDVSAAGSFTDEQSFTGNRVRFTLPENDKRPEFYVEGTYFDDGFSGVGSNRFRNQIQSSAAAGVYGQAPFGGRFEIGGEWLKPTEDAFFSEDEWSVFGTYNRFLFAGAAMRLSANYSRFGGEDEFGVVALFTYQFGNNDTLTADYNTRSERQSYSHSRGPADGLTGFYTDTRIASDFNVDDGPTTLFFDGSYLNPRANFSLSRTERLSGTSSFGRDEFTGIGIDTTFAFADGAWGLTSNGVGQAFALTRPKTKTDPETVVNPFGPREYDGRSGRFGAAFTGLNAYAKREVIVRPASQEALFGTTDGDQARVEIEAPYRAGFIVSVGEEDYSGVAEAMKQVAGEVLFPTRAPYEPPSDFDTEPIEYVTSATDSLYSVALSFGIGMDELRSANDLQPSQTVVPAGTLLIIPVD